jgi:hypothetical protein
MRSPQSASLAHCPGWQLFCTTGSGHGLRSGQGAPGSHGGAASHAGPLALAAQVNPFPQSSFFSHAWAWAEAAQVQTTKLPIHKRADFQAAIRKPPLALTHCTSSSKRATALPSCANHNL